MSVVTEISAVKAFVKFYYFFGFTACGDPSRMRIGATLAC